MHETRVYLHRSTLCSPVPPIPVHTPFTVWRPAETRARGARTVGPAWPGTDAGEPKP